MSVWAVSLERSYQISDCLDAVLAHTSKRSDLIIDCLDSAPKCVFTDPFELNIYIKGKKFSIKLSLSKDGPEKSTEGRK